MVSGLFSTLSAADKSCSHAVGRSRRPPAGHALVDDASGKKHMSQELPEVVLSALARTFPRMKPCVLSVEQAPSHGHMSQSARILFGDGRCRQPRAVFAKWPADEIRLRRLAKYSGAYMREVMFYKEIAPTCMLDLPHVYLSDYDPNTDDFVILLEDLASLRPGDVLQSSPRDVEQVLRAIAPFHAHWMDKNKLRGIHWLRSPEDAFVRKYVRLEVNRVQRAVARGRFGGDSKRRLLPLLVALGQKLDQLLIEPAPDRQTLVHGDLHLNQIFFPASEGGKPSVVDWQTIQRGSVGMDVARLITLDLTVEDRRKHETDLLHAYQSALEARGIQGYTPATCFDDYLRGILWTVFMNAVLYISRVQETASEMHQVLFGRIIAAADDHGLVSQ